MQTPKGHAWAIFVLSIVKLRFTIGICAAGFARADRRLSKLFVLASPLGACYTGNTRENTDNLVDAVYNKGADAVLGFEDVIFINEANLWTQVFMTELTEGVTLAEAMSVADNVVQRELGSELSYISTNSVHRYLLGSEQLIPCP